MKRWHRAFIKNDKDFKELFGVKKEVFNQMHTVLTAFVVQRFSLKRIGGCFLCDGESEKVRLRTCLIG